MFAALTGEHIDNARYVQLLREYSSGEDVSVEKDAVKLIGAMGVIYIAEGIVLEEEVVI